MIRRLSVQSLSLFFLAFVCGASSASPPEPNERLKEDIQTYENLIRAGVVEGVDPFIDSVGILTCPMAKVRFESSDPLAFIRIDDDAKNEYVANSVIYLTLNSAPSVYQITLVEGGRTKRFPLYVTLQSSSALRYCRLAFPVAL